jgi:uncharacterized membrane protein YagU involved in acid resistance
MTTTFSLASAKPALTVSKAILWGGLVAGALDATDGVVAFGLQGLNPIQVLQYIASGVLGKAAFSGGLAAAGLGTLLHFFIAFTVAAAYILASQKILALKARPVTFGLTFGVLVYLVMNFIVLPKSAVAPSPFSLAMFLNGIIGHALFVGLPIALFSRRTAE